LAETLKLKLIETFEDSSNGLLFMNFSVAIWKYAQGKAVD
jgi:hypothetical protein